MKAKGLVILLLLLMTTSFCGADGISKDNMVSTIEGAKQEELYNLAIEILEYQKTRSSIDEGIEIPVLGFLAGYYSKDNSIKEYYKNIRNQYQGVEPQRLFDLVFANDFEGLKKHAEEIKMDYEVFEWYYFCGSRNKEFLDQLLNKYALLDKDDIIYLLTLRRLYDRVDDIRIAICDREEPIFKEVQKYDCDTLNKKWIKKFKSKIYGK